MEQAFPNKNHEVETDDKKQKLSQHYGRDAKLLIAWDSLSLVPGFMITDLGETVFKNNNFKTIKKEKLLW